jgi:uncharacterized protein
MNIVIAGGAGHLGRILARNYHEQGHIVAVLSRHPVTAPWRMASWNEREVEGADVLVNLAGRSVNCRYNARHRREIMESRVVTTRFLADAVARAANPPRVWMNASTATIYRHSLDRDMDEFSGSLGGNEPGAPASWNFSIDVARSWEQAFFSADTPRTRRIALRSAMVMSSEPGGVFGVLHRLVRLGLGGRMGSGRQYVSWIHHDDFLAAVDFLVTHSDVNGVVNLSAPHPLPNVEFMGILREACGMPLGLPAPRSWMLEIGAFLLRTETELILKSRRVTPRRLLDQGFAFRFPHWREAAVDLVRPGSR